MTEHCFVCLAALYTYTLYIYVYIYIYIASHVSRTVQRRNGGVAFTACLQFPTASTSRSTLRAQPLQAVLPMLQQGQEATLAVVRLAAGLVALRRSQEPHAQGVHRLRLAKRQHRPPPPAAKVAAAADATLSAPVAQAGRVATLLNLAGQEVTAGPARNRHRSSEISPAKETCLHRCRHGRNCCCFHASCPHGQSLCCPRCFCGRG